MPVMLYVSTFLSPHLSASSLYSQVVSRFYRNASTSSLLWSQAYNINAQIDVDIASFLSIDVEPPSSSPQRASTPFVLLPSFFGAEDKEETDMDIDHSAMSGDELPGTMEIVNTACKSNLYPLSPYFTFMLSVTAAPEITIPTRRSTRQQARSSTVSTPAGSSRPPQPSVPLSPCRGASNPLSSGTKAAQDDVQKRHRSSTLEKACKIIFFFFVLILTIY